MGPPESAVNEAAVGARHVGGGRGEQGERGVQTISRGATRHIGGTGFGQRRREEEAEVWNTEHVYAQLVRLAPV